jgi:hypothetical protein
MWQLPADDARVLSRPILAHPHQDPHYLRRYGAQVEGRAAASAHTRTGCFAHAHGQGVMCGVMCGVMALPDAYQCVHAAGHDDQGEGENGASRQ